MGSGFRVCAYMQFALPLRGDNLVVVVDVLEVDVMPNYLSQSIHCEFHQSEIEHRVMMWTNTKNVAFAIGAIVILTERSYVMSFNVIVTVGHGNQVSATLDLAAIFMSFFYNARLCRVTANPIDDRVYPLRRNTQIDGHER